MRGCLEDTVVIVRSARPARYAHILEGAPSSPYCKTPHRFRTKRQLWTYRGLGLKTHDTAPCEAVEGQSQETRDARWPEQEPQQRPQRYFQGSGLETAGP
jgi:hypothetical protein